MKDAQRTTIQGNATNVVYANWRPPTMLPAPRFRREDLDPAKLAAADIGESFQRFVWQAFLPLEDELRSFAGIGKDGAIDISLTKGEVRLVIECKCIGEDGLSAAKQRWRETERNLEKNLNDPAGPPAEPQYGPWYRQDPPITRYWFCTSSALGSQENQDKLRDRIADSFRGLADTHAHLAHLRNIEVKVFDWGAFEAKLELNRLLALEWFPPAFPGFALLSAPTRLTGFRSYLYQGKLPYYSRDEHASASSVWTEQAILDRLAAGPDIGVIITGPGGTGKSRLTLEVGRLAQTQGWIVFRVHEDAEAATLQNIARACQTGRTLLLIDYVETQRQFSQIVSVARDLNDEYGCRLAYAANCRNSFYAAIDDIPDHCRVEIGGVHEAFSERVVAHILSNAGLPADETHLSVCRDSPILAVFLFYLKESGRQDDLRELLEEKDFGNWIARRIKATFAARSVELNADIGMLFAFLPLDARSHWLLFDDNRWQPLLAELANDRWIEQSSDAEDGPTWRSLHDVIADQVLLRSVDLNRGSAQAFVTKTLDLAARYGALRSAFLAFQRIGMAVAQSGANWREILNFLLAREPEAAKDIRDLLLRTSVLDPRDQVGLLLEHWPVWEGAESEIEIQNRLGWIVRWLGTEEGKPLAASVRDSLTPWLSELANTLRQVTS